MDSIVSNSSPLIYLAKADELELLTGAVKQIMIPSAVHREVVVLGKQLNELDAHRVENAIESGRISINDVTVDYPTKISIHKGESEVISLAKQERVEYVLMDDAKARMAAELAGLQPVGTLWVVLQSVKKHKVGFDQFLTIMEQLVRSGFYLRDEVYLKALRIARELSK